MKPKLSPFYLLSFIFCLLSFVFSPSALSQIPQGFNYQAIARDGITGNPITDLINVRIAILSDDTPETVIWEELHTGVDPDDHGLFNIVVGSGVYESGPVLTFDAIDWTVTTRYIRTMIYYGGSWKNMGSAQLWSVPYAMVADSLGGPLKKLEVEGETEDMEESLFEVRNKEGHIVFAVYNEGVRIYVSDGDAKGPKGGFAIGGFGLVKQDDQHYFFVSGDSIRAYIDSTSTKGVKGGFAIGGFDYTKGKSQDYMKVTRDSVRIYLDANPATKGPKGGFAIGGFDYTKAEEEEYLRVTRDSTRINVNDNPVKGVKGGFAIGGFGTGKGPVTPFTSLTPENYLIGHKSGSSINNGLYNSFFGYEAGMNHTDGFSNIFIGYRTGHQNTTGGNNVIIGNGSGYYNQTGDLNVIIGNRAGLYGTNGYGNVFLGDSAGLGNISDFNVFIGKGTGLYNEGKYNSLMGYEAGMYNTTGTYNAFLGYRSGRNNTTGSYNTFIGYQAGLASPTLHGTGSYNMIMGYNSGYSLTSGYNNVLVGVESGYKITSGFDNILIGKKAGYNITTGNSNIAIGLNTGLGLSGNQLNTLVGEKAGNGLASGDENAFYGSYAGFLTNGADENTFIGYDCGYSNETGEGNTYIGWRAGRQSHGSYNVFIGRQAGLNEDESRRLYIENSGADKDNALIYGEFDNSILVFNADVGIGTSSPAGTLDVCKDFPVLSVRTSATISTDAVIRIGGARTTSITDDLSRIEFYNYESGGPFELARISARNGDATSGTSHGDLTFQVNNGSGLIQAMYITDNARVGIGTSNPAWRFQVGETLNYGWVAANGSWQSSSDIRYKENMIVIDSALDKVLEMNGIYFNVIGNDPEKDRQIGFIAQEMEKILPEVVSTDSEGFKGISYSQLTPILVEAIKEQQAQIEAMKAIISRMEEKIASSSRP